MKTRLAVGLALGFLFEVSSVQAGQSSCAVSANEDERIVVGVTTVLKPGWAPCLESNESRDRFCGILGSLSPGLSVQRMQRHAEILVVQILPGH
jgi:hypothetical protein